MDTPQFSINFRALKRSLYLMLATLLTVAGLPLFGGKALAATQQLGNRSIQMSDSTISGTSITTGVGSGTSVTYEVSIELKDNADSLAIDFCAEDPILGDTCTKPSGMSLPTAVAAPSDITGSPSPITNWTLAANGGGTGIELTDGGTAGSVGSNNATVGVHVFDLTGITNPTTLGSFYARIYTYTDNDLESSAGAGTQYSAPNALGDYKNYGGFALSTTRTITITARVQETLTFCITKAGPDTWLNTTPNNPTGAAGDCSAGEVGAAANAPAVTLGSGSPTPVLTANTVDIGSNIGAATDNPVFTQLSTNATHGAVINLHNSNTSCGGLSADNGSTCAIPAIDQSAGNACTGTPEVACPMTAGTAAFGLFVNQYIPTTSVGTVGTITPNGAYYDAAHCGADSANTPCPGGNGTTWFGMDSLTTAANGGTPASNIGNVTSTFGSTVASSSGPVYHFDNEYQFAATAALTTPAGIYSANMSLIATGTF
jgi:hypothetical protein